VHVDRNVLVCTHCLGKSGINVHYCVLFENVEEKVCVKSSTTTWHKKKAIDSFKLEWLKVKVTTDTPDQRMFRLN
jgi:hypothetical protein